MFLCIDIETKGDSILAKKSGFLSNFSAPSNYKDPVKKAAYVERKRIKALEKLALKPLFAQIDVITIYDGETDKVLQWSNPELKYTKEKEIIEEAITYLNSHSSTARGSKEIVTFNGKRFDFPVIMARGEVVGAQIPFRWVQTQTGWKNDHYDLMDGREHSFNVNIYARFGERKPEIDFDKASIKERKKYARKEIRLMAKWYSRIMGYDKNEK